MYDITTWLQAQPPPQIAQRRDGSAREDARRVLAISSRLVEDYGGLNGALVLDRLESLAVLLEFEDLVHNPLRLDLPAVQVVDGLSLTVAISIGSVGWRTRPKERGPLTEHVHLRE